jgi:hypothetical protein
LGYGLTCVSARSSRPAQTPVRRRYFWAKHPEIASGTSAEFHAVSLRASPSHVNGAAQVLSGHMPCYAKTISHRKRVLTCVN